MTEPKDAIRQFAHDLGYDLCGFSRIARARHSQFVEHWQASGNGAGMEYLGRNLNKRLDPDLVLAGARTMVSVGLRYAAPPPPPVNWRAELRGRIAAYAYGIDYHKPMQRSLKQLGKFIEELFPGERALSYVDTGPVLEREWATLGGLGWFGKNTVLLTTRQGSWFLLGEIITTAELEPDELHPDRCGRCRSCLDQCPTGGLKPGYELDARFCISYWTIEHRGPIPFEMRPLIGNWLFGCDICQEVCPWNNPSRLPPARPGPILSDGMRGTSYAGQPWTATPSFGVDDLAPWLPQFLRFDESAFEARFRGTSLWRTRREGLARNACVVLGNTGNPAAVEDLSVSLENDPSPVVRGHASWALGRISVAPARLALERRRRHEEAAEVIEEIDRALETFGVDQRSDS